jgi:hypothetical protein
VSSGSQREDPLAILEILVRGLADRLNRALARVLLDVEYLGDLIDELAEAAARPRDRVDAVLDDVIGAVSRLRDVITDVEALAGDEPGDAAVAFAAALRLLQPTMAHAELIDQLRGPAPSALSRRALASLALPTLGEVGRAVTGCRGTLVASCERGDAEVVIALRATIAEGAHLLDVDAAAWGDIRARLEPHGGALALDRGEAGFAIELRLPAAQR